MESEVPLFDSEVLGLFSRLSEALGGPSATVPAVALLLMICVALLRRMPAIANKIPNHWVPAYAVGLGCLEALGQGLLEGWPWTAVVARGVMTGVMAIGMWEAGGKQILKPFFAKLSELALNVRTWIVTKWKAFKP